MKLLSSNDLVSKYCALLHKYAIVFACDEGYDIPEIQKAIPFLTEEEILMYNEGIILCESKECAYKLFACIVGDDGPTELNNYNGPARVYACVYGPAGPESENT